MGERYECHIQRIKIVPFGWHVFPLAENTMSRKKLIQTTNQQQTYHAHGLVLAVAVPVKNLHPQGAIAIAIAQRRHGDLGRSPVGTQRVVDLLAFPHHGVLVVFVQSDLKSMIRGISGI